MQEHLFRTFEPSTCTSVYQIPCFTYYFQQQEEIWGEKCERTFCEKEIGKERERKRKSERKTSFYLPEFGGGGRVWLQKQNKVLGKTVL